MRQRDTQARLNVEGIRDKEGGGRVVRNWARKEYIPTAAAGSVCLAVPTVEDGGRGGGRRRRMNGEEEATRATLLYTRSGWGPCGTWDHEWDVSWLTCPRAEGPESDVLGSTCQTWMGKLPLTFDTGELAGCFSSGRYRTVQGTW